jgi:hypothetical protein
MSIEVYIIILLAILYIYNEKCDVKIYGVINFFANNLKLTVILLVFLVVTFNPHILLYYYDFNKSDKHSRGTNYTGLKPNNNVKRNVSESKKKFVASNQQWKCSSCNELLDATYEIDHITPLYKGGTNEVSNLKALCRNCHGKKTLMDRIG